MGLFESIMRQRGQQGAQSMQQPAEQRYPGAPTQEQFRSDLSSIKNDPASYLRNLGLQIPEGMTDPAQITQHLLNTKQIPQGRYQQVMRALGGMRR